jgi:ubiquinol oxidase
MNMLQISRTCTPNHWVIKAQSKDYGYKSNHVERTTDIIPMSFFKFCYVNVKKEIQQKRYGFLSDPYSNSNSKQESFGILRLRKRLKMLKLDDANIWKREQNREAIECPRMVLAIYYSICHMLDIIFKDKPIDRFWFLESVARMPYFSYIAIIHMYETLGWWELDGHLKKKHYEEETNETYHLRIMESLGGNSNWWNRFLARHGAMAYYGILLILFMVSPKLAYLSSELLEMHAVDTYTEFYESNETILKALPPTEEALEYNPYVENLYEVFKQISEDEFNHAKQMNFVKQLPNKK